MLAPGRPDRHSRRTAPADKSRVGVAVAAAALAVGLLSCGQGGERAQHVIVISMDTARADAFGFLGNATIRTPRLDSLAREAIVFEDCMTAATTTLASHVSLFTGNYPHTHGTPRNGFMVNRDNEMLPEILKRSGFHTAGFTGSFALDKRFDFAQGFDHYDEEHDVLIGQGGVDQNQRSGAAVTDAVIRYLDGMAIPDRLFLFVHYFDPHQPFAAPPPYDTMYDPEGRARLPTMRELKLSSTMTHEERIRFSARFEMQYAGEISYMDEQIGRLLTDLRRRGILDRALLVITSDHGENLSDHPLRFDHGTTLYQSTLRSVCVMRLPGAHQGGTRRRELVSNIDLLPTVLRHLGITPPAAVEGQAVDLLTVEQSDAVRIRFGEATKPWKDVETDPRWVNMRKGRCIRDGRFKFVQIPWRGTEELYDLVADPQEMNDLLARPSPETLAEADSLRAKLERWAESARPLPSRFEPAQQDETVRRLKSLGYIN